MTASFTGLFDIQLSIEDILVLFSAGDKVRILLSQSACLAFEPDIVVAGLGPFAVFQGNAPVPVAESGRKVHGKGHERTEIAVLYGMAEFVLADALALIFGLYEDRTELTASPALSYFKVTAPAELLGLVAGKTQT